MDTRKSMGAIGLAAILSLVASVAQAGLIIDDFNTSTNYSVTDNGSGPSYLPAPVTANNTALGILGGPTGWSRVIYAQLEAVTP